MRLKLVRTQELKGMMNKSIAFVVFAKADLTEQEKFLIAKYRLGNDVIYSSEAQQKNLDAAQSSTSTVGALARIAMAKLSLHVTVNSLTEGQTITCSTLQEALGAEGAIREACNSLSGYLEAAETFDGREEIVEFGSFGEDVDTTEELPPPPAESSSGFLG